MRLKLEKFVQQIQSGGAKSTYWERFRVLKKKDQRDACLKSLRQRNKDMERLLNGIFEAAHNRPVVSTGRKPPSSQLRTLSQRLFSTLSGCWKCSCKKRHEAKFCLHSCGKTAEDQEVGKSGVSFEFVVSRTEAHAAWGWLEGMVTIKASR